MSKPPQVDGQTATVFGTLCALAGGIVAHVVSLYKSLRAANARVRVADIIDGAKMRNEMWARLTQVEAHNTECEKAHQECLDRCNHLNMRINDLTQRVRVTETATTTGGQA